MVGLLSSEGGILVLREVEQRLRLWESLARGSVADTIRDSPVKTSRRWKTTYRFRSGRFSYPLSFRV